MARVKQIETGTVFGQLTVIGFEGIGKHEAHFRCRCVCGKETTPTGSALRTGRVQSCGCFRPLAGQHMITHGLMRAGNKHYLYPTWSHIKQRVLNPKCDAFHRYGGRGIRMHEEWVNDLAGFISWIEENLGDRPEGFTLDRINPNGHYEPGNLRWASAKTQNNNQSCREAERQFDDLSKWVMSWI